MKSERRPAIRRQEVVELLKSLEGFSDLPGRGLDLPKTLAANAQRAQIEAKKRFSVTLSSDAHGIRALSSLLTSMHEAMRPGQLGRLLGSKISFNDAVLIANTFGAFLGEVMRQTRGGEWRLVDSQGQKLVTLWISEKNWSLPTYKAGKHFMYGEQDDVRFFYEVFVTGGLKDVLVITQGDIAKGQEHLADLVARHERNKKDKSPG